MNKIQFFVLKILAFLIADYVMLMGEQCQPQLRGREGPGNKAIRWQALAGRHWLADTGYVWDVSLSRQQTCSCVHMISMASIFGDIRKVKHWQLLGVEPN